MLDWASINFTNFANALLGLITAAIIYASVKVGRRTKPELPVETTKISGAAIISDGAVMAFAASVEGLSFEMIATRQATAAAAALLATAQKEAAEKLAKSQDELQDTMRATQRDYDLMRQDLRDLTLQMASRR